MPDRQVQCAQSACDGADVRTVDAAEFLVSIRGLPMTRQEIGEKPKTLSTFGNFPDKLKSAKRVVHLKAHKNSCPSHRLT